ncbi:MAG: SDR family oxidoreductase, partial [Acidimicrobiaceae bacterium]|nr:SDR family oxidoreductase [Acidimicrobiaceae bacterium]
MLREALAGRRIAITGGTGFLGTALIERVLRSVPDCDVALLVRPGRRGAEARVRREILRNNCFDRLRRQLGERFDPVVANRIQVLAGDVRNEGLGLDDAGLAVLEDCDVVVHSAATVSFDSPLDSAVEVNLLGPSRVARTLLDLHADSGKRPHLIAVSTAYVAGSRRGPAPEATLPETPWATDVAWRSEVEAARRARADVEADSRDPKLLARFHRMARAELGAAGTPLLARG